MLLESLPGTSPIFTDTQSLILSGKMSDKSGILTKFLSIPQATILTYLSVGRPPPRTAHQAAVIKNSLYVFGGELTSVNQVQPLPPPL